jgi:hypothetical protein
LTSEWEVGEGTWSTGNTLARNTVFANSLGTTAKIAFSAGDKDVFVTYPSDKALLGTTSAVASTGTSSVVLSDSPSLTGAVTIGGTTDTTTLTFGRSTAAQTVNIATGVTAASTTKAINIGNAGNATSTTNIGIGSNTGTSATTVNGAVTLSATTQALNIGNSQTSGAITIGGTSSTGAITLGRSVGTQTIDIGNSVVGTGATKTVNIGTSPDLAAGTTNINIGTDNNCNVNFSPYTNVNFGAYITTAGLPVGSLPYAGVLSGARAFVEDAVNPRVGSVVVDGEGSGTPTPVFYDGTNWICDAGLGATTGTGNVVLSDSPTFTTAITSTGALQLTGSATVAQNIATAQTTGNLTIGGASATGSTTLNGNVKLATKASLPTASAGLVEYDGSAFYNSIAASTRGVMPSEQFVILNAPYTLASQTAAQQLFNNTTNGAVTLPIGTYQFECLFSLTSLSGTSGAFGFAIVAGTAVVGSQGWLALAGKPSAFNIPSQSATYNTSANTSLMAITANTNGYAFIKGTIKITTAGTIIPSVSMTQASAAVVGANSYFKISPVSGTSAANITVGNWS